LLNKAVKSNGAVSPDARTTASMTPGSMPGSAVGNPVRQTTWLGVQPMPTAASFIRAGTIFMASSAVSMTVGTIRIASATPPVGAE